MRSFSEAAPQALPRPSSSPSPAVASPSSSVPLAAHDKVCGDFLSTEALSSLSSLGLNVSALGAVPIHNVRLAGSLGISSAILPFAAQSLTRRALDEALLQRASAARALVLRGHSAESLHRNGKLWRVSITGPSHAYTLTAPHILLATGKHDLRGLPRPLLGTHADLVGLKMYLRLAPAQIDELRDTIELFLLHGGYGGLSLVESRGNSEDNAPTSASSSSATSSATPLAAGTPSPRSSRETPHLRTRLAGAEPLLARPLAISPIPYGLLRRHAIAENLWAIGDQAAVIPSFTGDGLALALHSGRFAARTLLAGQSAHHFHAELHKQLRRQLSLATVLSRAPRHAAAALPPRAHRMRLPLHPPRRRLRTPASRRSTSSPGYPKTVARPPDTRILFRMATRKAPKSPARKAVSSPARKRTPASARSASRSSARGAF